MPREAPGESRATVLPPAPQDGAHALSETKPLQPVSVIVVNYNGGALLGECIAAALDQAAQVIVVDNGSTDSSIEALEERFPGYARLVVERAGTNLGFAAGCNRGMAHATQPLLLFLNPDCVLDAASLQHMAETLHQDARIGMVGGLLANPDGSEQGACRRALPTPWRSFVRAFGLARLSRRWPRAFPDFHLDSQALPAAPTDVEAISGALMLVRRTAIDAVGPWDEAYFLHCEDLDWCMRFRQHGWRVVFDPAARAVHQKGNCSRSQPVFVEWHKHKGMLRFYRKFFRDRYPVVVTWAVAGGIWLHFGQVSARHLARRLLGRQASRDR